METLTIRLKDGKEYEVANKDTAKRIIFNTIRVARYELKHFLVIPNTVLLADYAGIDALEAWHTIKGGE